MDEEHPEPFPPEHRSLEDELRSQFGPDVLIDNDEQEVDAGSVSGDHPPEDEDDPMAGHTAGSAHDSDEYEERDDYGPMDLRATTTHGLSESDEEPNDNPLRRIINKTVSASFVHIDCAPF